MPLTPQWPGQPAPEDKPTDVRAALIAVLQEFPTMREALRLWAERGNVRFLSPADLHILGENRLLDADGYPRTEILSILPDLPKHEPRYL